MKLRITLFLIIALVPASVLAQELTVTATSANTVSSKTSIDLPGLTGNPLAIIVATPVGNTAQLNTHPVGAWYYSGKWNIFNTDHAVMPLGAKYKVRFFKEPGPNQFMHLVTQQNLGAEGSYIDNPALNNNPNAQVAIFQNYAPDVRTPYYLNRFEAKASYSSAAERWYIANVNGEPIGRGTVYNIVVTPAATVGANTNPPATPPGPNPISLPPPNPGPTDVPIGNRPPTPAPGVQPPTPPIAVPKPPVGPKQPARDWVLRDEEVLPTIPANSDIILFIHGMDSRAEEAEDITRALFALKDNMPASVAGPPTPPSGGSQTGTQQMVTVLRQLLQKYKGCILEKYETQQDMVARGLSPNLSGLTSATGLQARDANVVCVAGNICSLGARAASWNILQGQATRGDATNFETLLKQAVPKDCFNCTKHVEMHTKHVHCTMDAGGNFGIPGIAFEICKGGVDLEALANSVLTDIHNVFVNITGKVPENEVIGGASVATNYSTVRFNECTKPDGGCPESCPYLDLDNGPDAPRTAVVPQEGQQILYYALKTPRSLLDSEPPTGEPFNVPAAHNIGGNEGRLRADLRKAAADPYPQSLRLASYRFALGDTVTGNAFADLSVTGRRAFRDFKLARPKEDFCQSLASERSTARPPQLQDDEVLNGCRTALDRAYRVANFLRTGQRGDTGTEKTRKTNERNALGWIAVSGEDDQPHRPVNVPSSDFPQYDLDMIVEAPLAGAPVALRTRYVVAQSRTMSPSGRNLVVISLDLPTSGYTDNLDYDKISPLALIGQPKTTFLQAPIIIPVEILYVIPGAPILPPGIVPGIMIPQGTPLPDFEATGQTPVLDFIENFIVRFGETLDQKVPVKNNFRAVMGGSLGGNMTFRLGRRPNLPWLPKFIVWSPASIWTSLGEGIDILKHIGPRTAWEGANRTHNFPTTNDRAQFFGSWDQQILPLLIPMAQSDTWTSDYYPCKKSVVAAARLERHETYDPNFLSWRWRLGGEQLLYSHQSKDPTTNRPRFMSNLKPMLLACGTEDHVKFNDICPATQRTAPLMTLTPGKALFLDKTGHSLDNERKTFWARQIFEFLGLK